MTNAVFCDFVALRQISLAAHRGGAALVRAEISKLFSKMNFHSFVTHCNLCSPRNCVYCRAPNTTLLE